MIGTSIKQKTIKGILWNAIEKFLVKGTSFAISIFLARILSPSDYGLIGMLAVFIALSNVFIESGFAKALIQKQDCTDTDYSTAFYSNLGISVFIYLSFFVLAPYVAQFYNEPLLCDVLRILSINFVLGAFNIVQRAKLMARMDFKSLAKINFIGTLIGGIGGLAMAYTGWGVWALVGQTIVSTVVMLFLFPHYSQWKPKLVFSSKSFKDLFGFGSKLLISGTVATVVNNIATIAIGKTYKSSQLGFYAKATNFADLIALTVNDILGTVTFPVLSELQNDKERMVAVYQKSLFFSAMVIFPVMILMALLAKPMILALLTEKWLPAVILLQIMCLAKMFTPLSAINLNLLNAIGRSDLFMKVDLSKIPLILIVLAITIPISVKAIVLGSLFNTFVCFFINTYYPGKLFGYGAWKQIKDWKYIFLSLIIMAVVVILYLQIVSNAWVQFIGGGIIGILTYIACCFKLKLLDWSTIKSFRKR